MINNFKVGNIYKFNGFSRAVYFIAIEVCNDNVLYLILNAVGTNIYRVGEISTFSHGSLIDTKSECILPNQE